jgi:hypothetical protein
MNDLYYVYVKIPSCLLSENQLQHLFYKRKNM